MADEDTTSDAASDVTTTLNFWSSTNVTTTQKQLNNGTYGDVGNYIYSGEDPFQDSVTVTGDVSVAETEVLAKGIYGTVKWYISMDGVLHLGAGTPITYSSTSPLGDTSPWAYCQNIITSISIDGAIKLVGPTSPTQGANFIFSSLSKVTSISGANNLDFTGVIDVNSMFKGTTSLKSITGTESWNLSTVTAASSMFMNSGITSLNVSNWGMGSVKQFSSMFNGDSGLVSIIGIGNWSMTSATSLVYMFFGASRLESLDFTNWNTKNVTNMDQTFSGMTALKQITFGKGFVTTNVTGGSIALPNTTSTTKWVNVGTGSVTEPQASTAISVYTGTAPDTYVLDSLVSATLSSPSFTYDGTTSASKSSELTTTVKIAGVSNASIVVKLSMIDGDVTFTTDGTNVGTYEYQLTKSGLTKVQNAIDAKYANYNLLAADVAVGTVTINPAKYTGELTSSKLEKTYDGSTFTTVPVITGPTGDYTLKDGDYTFNTTDPVNDGDYTYTLTTQGIANVKAFNSNYDLGDLVSQVKGTATINKAKATITVDDADFDYNGASHSIPDGNVTIGGAVVAGEQLDYSLTNNARTDAGSQIVGIALTDGSSVNANYDITVTDTATLTINQATTDPSDKSTSFSISDATSYYGENSPTFVVTPGSNVKDPGNLTNDDFTFIDKATGQVVDGVPTDVGSYEVILNYSGKAKVAATNPNYNFSDGSFVSGTYTIYDVITHSQVTVTRTVHYTGAGSRTPKDVV